MALGSGQNQDLNPKIQTAIKYDNQQQTVLTYSLRKFE